MEAAELEKLVLQHVLDAHYKPVKPRVIAKQLGLPEDERESVRRAVKRLAKQGKVQYGANHAVKPPKSQAVAKRSANQVTGTFRRAQAGFGFVRPSGAPAKGPSDKDIFVPESKTGDAVTGDTVLVELNFKRLTSRGNPEGRVIEVIERETHQFVGTYFETAGQGYVQVDGTIFAQPIRVGDPGAKNARPDDKVVFEMVRFPTPWHDGEGVITEVLGSRGQPGVDTLTIIREYNLPEQFAEDVVHESRLEAERFEEETIPEGRLDLTGETIITIDPVDARDFDDAISLERIDKDHWRLGVHIADVSHFVRPRTALDREAHNRATSVYLPDRVIPMLPEIISNGLASLQPDRVRYTKTAIIEFSPEGARIAVDLHSAAIRSKRRFTYEEVDEYLADPEVWKSRLSPEVHSLLGRMHELAMILRKRRAERGALEMSLGELKVDLDRDGKVVGAHQVENTVSHQIIEEFMLSANEAVADYLRENKLLFLRRVHEAPDPRKLLELTEFVAELGFETESLESRFELQRLLRLVTGRPEEHTVNYAVLRAMQQAVYSPIEEGHYALASDCYCHFTSPIRRYPDLTVHRLIDAVAQQKQPVQEMGELVALGEHCSQRERRAEAAERELTKLKLLSYLEERVGMELDAIITGVAEFGLFAQGIELPAEGLVHVSSLTDDYYRFERNSHSLVGYREGNCFRLGDRIRVVIARVDVDRRELDLRVIGRLKRDVDGVELVPSGNGQAGSGKRHRKDEKKQGKGKGSSKSRAKKRR